MNIKSDNPVMDDDDRGDPMKEGRDDGLRRRFLGTETTLMLLLTLPVFFPVIMSLDFGLSAGY